MHPRLLYTKTSRSSSAIKPAGTPTQSSHIGTSDMESLLKNHLFSSRKFHRAKSGEPYLAIIHRLDQPVEGILVFAKNTCRRKGTKPPAHFPRIWEILSCSNIRHSRTAGRLSWKLSRQRYPYKQFRSLYENDSGSKTCQTSLQNNRNIRCDPENEKFTDSKSTDTPKHTSRNHRQPPLQNESSALIEIHLDTGRHHQIRVQMAYFGHPL